MVPLLIIVTMSEDQQSAVMAPNNINHKIPLGDLVAIFLVLRGIGEKNDVAALQTIHPVIGLLTFPCVRHRFIFIWVNYLTQQGSAGTVRIVRPMLPRFPEPTLDDVLDFGPRGWPTRNFSKCRAGSYISTHQNELQIRSNSNSMLRLSFKLEFVAFLLLTSMTCAYLTGRLSPFLGCWLMMSCG